MRRKHATLSAKLPYTVDNTSRGAAYVSDWPLPNKIPGYAAVSVPPLSRVHGKMCSWSFTWFKRKDSYKGKTKMFRRFVV